MTKLIAPTAKLVVVKKENPFAKDSAAYKRVAAVLSSKTKSEALKKGARTSTVRYCLNNGLIKIGAAAADKKPAAKAA